MHELRGLVMELPDSDRYGELQDDYVRHRDSRLGDYWRGYPLTVEPREIERRLGRASFASGNERHELLFFERARTAPNILVSPGWMSHALVYAELGYLLHLLGYNVFLLPRHGDHPVDVLVKRHADALAYVATRCNDRIGIFGEGLGGYATFYLALEQAHTQVRAPLRSMVLQGAPALLTEDAFQRAITEGDAAGRRRARLLPWARRIAKLFPAAKLPIASYLDFSELVDRKEDVHTVEAALVARYREDPDFDRRFSLSTILSEVSTPPPAPLEALAAPTMFIVPERGLIPAYVRELFVRLPAGHHALNEVDGGYFWTVSHPRVAAGVIASWFDETI